jgi:hypothetical protein
MLAICASGCASTTSPDAGASPGASEVAGAEVDPCKAYEREPTPPASVLDWTALALLTPVGGPAYLVEPGAYSAMVHGTPGYKLTDEECQNVRAEQDREQQNAKECTQLASAVVAKYPLEKWRNQGCECVKVDVGQPFVVQPGTEATAAQDVYFPAPDNQRIIVNCVNNSSAIWITPPNAGHKFTSWNSDEGRECGIHLNATCPH